jgi:probable poly-beta-1,6-N-acetyl-D-glucosamine export protein
MAHKDNFQHHIHIFRGLAIMLIVGAHAMSAMDWSDSPLTMRIVDAICNQSSIFFFFIAGYLFQHLSGRFRYDNYLRQKLKTVIVPYLLLSIPALIIFTQVVHRDDMWPWFYTLPVWEQVGLFLITGKHLAPLWFVPTITLFYLAAPLLIAIDRKAPRLYWAVLPLWLLAIYIGRDGPHGPLDKAIYLLPVYMLGMVFSHHQKRAEALVLKIWLPLLAITLVGMLGHVSSWPVPPHYLMIMKAPMGLLLTVALLRWHGIFGSRLDYIAHVSFGIFFIHAYFISALKLATTYLLTGQLYAGHGGALLPGNVPVFLAYVFVVLMMSLGTIRLVQIYAGKNSRMLVGA